MNSKSFWRTVYLDLKKSDGNLETDLEKAKAIALERINNTPGQRLDGSMKCQVAENVRRTLDIQRFYNYLSNSLLYYEHRPIFWRTHSNPVLRFIRICSE